MPYYSELGIYTPSSSYTSPLLKGPYSGHSSIIASNILPPSLTQFNRANFRGYKPHLTTISESNISAPLRRISSPKVLYHTSPKVKAPRPIKIYTSDIDVSQNRYNKYKPSLQSKPLKEDEASIPKKEPSPVVEKEAKPNKEIRRDRATIRIQTIHKDALEKEIGQIKSWRDNFKPEELTVEAKRRKKSPGEILKEKFLIRSKSKENVPYLEPPKHKILAVKKSPSFKDICNVITSDQAVEDLNPGQPIEVRRRQSRQFSHDEIIKEIQRSSSTLSVEEVQILDALLQAENEVGLYDVPPVIDEPDKGVRKRRTAKKKQKSNSSELINHRAAEDESKKQLPETRLRKDSSLKDMVKDISQVEIEMIPVKQKPVITGYIGSIEEKANNSLKAVVEDLEIQESPKQKKKEKKFRFNVTVQEFPVKKRINAPKYQLTKDDYGVNQTPSSQTLVVTSILKKREEKHAGVIAGEGKMKPKKKPLLKSLSEVQVKSNKEIAQIKKSESIDSVHSNFTVTVNKKDGDNSPDNKGSPQGSGKLKIVYIENSTDKVGGTKFSDNKVKVESIPKVELKLNSKDDVKKTDDLLKTTKKDLKPGTFLCKREWEKKNTEPSTIQTIVKEQKIEEPKAKEADVVTINENIDKDVTLCLPPDVSKRNDNNENAVAVRDELIKDKVENDIENLKIKDDKVDDKPEPPKLQKQNSNKAVEDEIKVKTDNEKVTINENKVEKKPEPPEYTEEKLEQKVDAGEINVKNENEKVNVKAEENQEPPKLGQLKLEQKDDISKPEDLNKEETNDNFWETQGDKKYKPIKLGKLKLEKKDPKSILKEIQQSHKKSSEDRPETPETPEEKQKRMISKRSLIQKANKDDPDLQVFEPPTPPPEKEPSPDPSDSSGSSFVPLRSNSLSNWMHPWKKPEQRDECALDIYAKPKFIRARHIPRRWRQNNALEGSESEDSTTSEEDSSGDESNDDEESECEEERGAQTKVGASTSSNDSGFDSGRAKNNECDVNCHKKCEKLVANLCGVNQKMVVEAIEKVRKGSIDSRDSPGNTLNPASNPAFALDFNDLPEEVSQSSTYQSFQRSGRITPPATTIPRFRKYCVDDFNFLKVLGKGSFGKVLLAELKGTEYYYAIKCLKKDVVLEDDDVECTLIERKVLALGTKHPYLCHLLCTFQTESHLFFVMEYLNGGDLMFHIQAERRFSEARARFYGAEIVSGLKFLHNKGIVYRDLKLDNILLDFDGHVRIADFGMCKLQIFLDRMADTFCGTPDYMAPEIIKGQHYNQCVDWWSFGVLLYEMLLGQSPFSGSDEDELFWSICNEKPVIPRFLSAEAGSVLLQFLEKDANKRLGNRFSPHGDIQDHVFFKAIDWTALEARRLESPFKPNLQHPLDTQYFDKTFTTERAKLTPIETGILQSMDQTQFQGFSYTNPNATDK